MITQAELIALAKQIAAQHNLWPELVCAICECESSWNPWAMRYEPGFYDRYVAPQVARGQLPVVTELRARAFFWGLMQVMGQVAHEAGFSGNSLAELCDPAKGIDVGCGVLERKIAAAEGSVVNALLLWNGGSNPAYPKDVMLLARKYQA